MNQIIMGSFDMVPYFHHLPLLVGKSSTSNINCEAANSQGNSLTVIDDLWALMSLTGPSIRINLFGGMTLDSLAWVRWINKKGKLLRPLAIPT